MNALVETATSLQDESDLWNDITSATEQKSSKARPFSANYTEELRKEYSVNRTAEQEESAALYAQLDTAFSKAVDEHFEDGMESDFSRQLITLIGIHGDLAVLELARLLRNPVVNPAFVGEALRWLGHMGRANAYDFRLWVLEHNLFSSSAYVRDGATLGLAFLDDPHAIRYLRQAIVRESYPELRKDMEQVLAQLETGL